MMWLNATLSAALRPAVSLLTAAAQDPYNASLQSQVNTLVLDNGPVLAAAAQITYQNLAGSAKLQTNRVQHVAASEFIEPVSLAPPIWTNVLQQQTCRPSEIRYPQSVQDIIDSISYARTAKRSIKAVGSGHSYSDVAPPPDGGILLDPHRLNRTLDTQAATLRDPARAKYMVSVENGILIRDLNIALDRKNLALPNMGGYDGQTLAGAISTGTHGTGAMFGPMSSIVRAIVLVTQSSEVWQIEPTNGISDYSRFLARNSQIRLKQDDDLFYSSLVSMGTMGVVYSYIIEVVDSFLLQEDRFMSTWEQVKPNLTIGPNGRLPSLLIDNRHFEVNVNPYAMNGRHSCIVQEKNKSIGPARGSRGFANWFSGLLASFPAAESVLIFFLNTFPWTSPSAINRALSTLVDSNYIGKSYDVLDLGSANQLKRAYAMELSIPVDERLIDTIDYMISVIEGQAKTANRYMAGPVSLRFVAASEAFLAPQQGRLSCMAELDTMLGIEHGNDLLKAISADVLRFNSRARIHWGLDLDTVTGQGLHDRYDQSARWLRVYRNMNSLGLFSSRFTDRLGISMPLVGGPPVWTPPAQPSPPPVIVQPPPPVQPVPPTIVIPPPIVQPSPPAIVIPPLPPPLNNQPIPAGPCFNRTCT